MSKQRRYSNIFMYSSQQFCGHIEEYFVAHTDKLVVYVINPRLKSKTNTLRVYEKGACIEERSVWSSGNLLLYYCSWYVHYVLFLFRYFSRSENVIVLAGHPVGLFGMQGIRLVRNIRFVYWIGDYFPPTHWSLAWFERVKKYYHNHVDAVYYLSDRINEIFNGNVMKTAKKRTVMWGVKNARITRKTPAKHFSILFVGLMKEGQGLERLFDFLARRKEYHLSIIGICPNDLYGKYQELIKRRHIARQIFFPNAFYSDSDLARLAARCHVGIAVYDTGKFSATYYTDPGKVKAYAEFGLPVIMTDTSSIASYIRRFQCGEIVEENLSNLSHALKNIHMHYEDYQKGVGAFLKHFEYERYYKNAFRYLETL